VPEIDLDDFDEHEYFPAWYHGNCIAIALALHQLTKWPLYTLRTPSSGHAVVLSPLGYFDGGGPNALDRFKKMVCSEYQSQLDEEAEADEVLGRVPRTRSPMQRAFLLDPVGLEVTISSATVEDLRDQYLRRRDTTGIEDWEPYRNLGLAIPLAQAVLQRYWTKQLPLFTAPSS
jgi:hypothetical protein